MKPISGLLNCHLPGLTSVVLSERESPKIGMRRIFHCTDSCVMNLMEGNDFRLKPHNHRQSIRLKLLRGSATNVRVHFGESVTHSGWRYAFGSALLNGEFSLRKLWREHFSLVSEPITAEGVDLHWTEFHTVTAEPNSAWLVEEGIQSGIGTERCISLQSNLRLVEESLYRPMTPEQLEKYAAAEWWPRAEGAKP